MFKTPTTANNSDTLETGRLQWLLVNRKATAASGAALVTMIVMFIITVGNLAQVSLDIERDRNVLYRETRAGDIENVYIVKIFNKGQTERTYTIDVSGHPAISVPCGEVEGLPVGCMLVGRHGDEATLYRLAAAIEAR